MPEEQKKGFVLYFSSYDNVAGLSPEQRGELFSALYEYARAAAADPAAEMRAVLPDHPAMDLETRMTFSFIAETIRRDTEKWWEKHRLYQAAARTRLGKAAAEPHPGSGEAWAYV